MLPPQLPFYQPLPKYPNANKWYAHPQETQPLLRKALLTNTHIAHACYKKVYDEGWEEVSYVLYLIKEQLRENTYLLERISND